MTPSPAARAEVASAAISGSVYRADGRAASGAKVSIYSASSLQLVARGIVSQDGSYWIWVPPGSYKVQFTLESPTSIPEWWNDVLDPSDATVITLASNERRSGIDASFDRGASIEGGVTLPSWVKMSSGSIRVDVYRASDPDTLVTSVWANPETRRYRAERLLPGDYKVEFTTTGLPVEGRWWGGATNFTAASTVTLMRNERRTRVDVTLPEVVNSAVLGTVALPAGVTGGTVTTQLYEASSQRLVKETVVAADGSYALRLLDPGVYKLRFQVSGAPVFSEWWSGGRTFDDATAITLALDEKRSEVDAVLTRFSSVSGKVTLPSGVSVSKGQVVVSVVDAGTQRLLGSATVRADGTYTVDGLRGGLVKVRFSSSSLPVVNEWWHDAYDFASARRFTLGEGQVKTGVNETLARAAARAA